MGTSKSLVIVGDLIRDIFVPSRATRISPESPNTVIETGDAREVAGGAGIGAQTLTNLGYRVVLAGAWDEPDCRLVSALRPEIALNLMPGNPIPRKSRYVSDGQIIARIDEQRAPRPTTESSAEALFKFRECLLDAPAIVVSDYGQDLTLANRPIREQLNLAAQRVSLVWDFHPRSNAVAPPGSYVKFNRPDFDSLTEASWSGEIHSAATKLLAKYDWRGILITEGPAGASYVDREGSHQIESWAFSLRNAIGAGDIVCALWALFIAECDSRSAATRAVQVASLALGVRETALAAVSHDINAQDLAIATRAVGATLVVTAGCFDLFHAGHVDLLNEARKLGDVLIVLLNSDASVTSIKGPGRPICTLADRLAILRGLRAVDAIKVFDDDTPIRELETLTPDVYVKGGDYRAHDLPESAGLLASGASVHIVPRNRDLSSTSIRQRCRQ